MTRALLSAITLLLLGCSRAPAGETLVVSSDAELAALAGRLLPDLAERSGLTLERPVRVERRSRDELVRFLTAKLHEELPVELEDRLVRSYAMFGLVPRDLDLRALLLSVYTEQVAGFYDPDSTALFVMEDQPTESLHSVLIHELVHAVQDQAVDLDSLTARERGSDHQAAAQAAIEGHATLVMFEYAMEQMGGSRVDLSESSGLGEQLRATLGTVREQFPALAAAPRVVQESLLFPYLEGAGFVQSLWQSEGRRAPFGPSMPQSTEQILHPDRLSDAPKRVVISVPEARVLYSDELGQLESGLLLEELSGRRDPDAAAGWGGDRYALLETPSGDALAWVVVWDTPADRDSFERALAPHLPGLPAAAHLERVEVGGAPGLILRIGDVGRVEASLGAVGQGAPR